MAASSKGLDGLDEDESIDDLVNNAEKFIEDVYRDMGMTRQNSRISSSNDSETSDSEISDSDSSESSVGSPPSGRCNISPIRGTSLQSRRLNAWQTHVQTIDLESTQRSSQIPAVPLPIVDEQSDNLTSSYHALYSLLNGHRRSEVVSPLSGPSAPQRQRKEIPEDDDACCSANSQFAERDFNFNDTRMRLTERSIEVDRRHFAQPQNYNPVLNPSAPQMQPAVARNVTPVVAQSQVGRGCLAHPQCAARVLTSTAGEVPSTERPIQVERSHLAQPQNVTPAAPQMQQAVPQNVTPVTARSQFERSLAELQFASQALRSIAAEMNRSERPTQVDRRHLAQPQKATPVLRPAAPQMQHAVTQNVTPVAQPQNPELATRVLRSTAAQMHRTERPTQVNRRQTQNVPQMQQAASQNVNPVASQQNREHARRLLRSNAAQTQSNERPTQVERRHLPQPRNVTPNVIPLAQPRNVIPVAQPQNVIPVAQPQNVIPVAQPQNGIPVAQPQNVIPVAQPQNVIPVVQSQNIAPVLIHSENTTPSQAPIQVELLFDSDRIEDLQRVPIQLKISIQSRNNNATTNNVATNNNAANQTQTTAANQALATNQTLPTNQIAAANQSMPFICSVCMESCLQRQPTSTKCGHIFCNECILRAIHYTHRCPLCNTRNNANEIFRLYF